MTTTKYRNLLLIGFIIFCVSLFHVGGSQHPVGAQETPSVAPAVTAATVATPTADVANKEVAPPVDAQPAEPQPAAPLSTEPASVESVPVNSPPAESVTTVTADDIQTVPHATAPSLATRGITNEKQGNTGLTLTIAALILAFSFLISYLLAKAWKMSEYQTAFFIILFCFLGGLASTLSGVLGNRMNLGIDLRGGSILVYGVTANVDENASAVEQERQATKTISNEEMGELKNALARRINPSGVREISIQELGNNSEIKITIPEADEVEVARLERIINSSGQLKFRILSSTDSPEEKELIDRARHPENQSSWEVRLENPIGKDGIILGGLWVPVDPTQMDSVRGNDVVLRDSLLKDPANAAAPVIDVLILQLTELYDVTGRHMATVREGLGQRGDPEVIFSMKSEGAERLQRLTNRYKAGVERSRGRQLGIVMNDFLYSAPAINDTISHSGVITFGNDLSSESRTRIQGEVRDLVQVMNAGVLPAKLSESPVTKMVTGPTLGADTIQKGKNSILWGGILVLAFMILYYGFGGLVASFAVIVNLLLIMTFMLGLRAAFTLPGLAGLILTVGMAVDANVLIFERIKEELSNGATTRMAIRNGFQRAFSAILDSNITTMLTAAILYTVGTDQIKGFAVTLFLGVAFSLFTATFVSRIIFETADRLGWIGSRCVYPLLRGIKPFPPTKFDFVGKSRIAIIISGILIAVGILGVIARGKGIFDIDFVGGVEIQTIFKEEQNIATIRSKLRSLPDLSVSNLSLAKDQYGNEVKANTCFTICTSCPPGKVADEYRSDVEHLLKEAFGDLLRHFTLDYKLEGIQELPVPGNANLKEKKIVAELTVMPPFSREVMLGFFEDKKEQIIAKYNLESLDFDVTSEKYHAGDKIAPLENWTLLLNNQDEALAKDFLTMVSNQVNEKQSFESSNTIGSSVASYARSQGMWAILSSLVCIILYIWVRFTKVIYGLSSVIALVYNVMITLGFIALSFWVAPYLGIIGINEFKIGLPTVAAFLTIIGYSLNDTIILFDRIREVRGKNMPLTKEVINLIINQTLSRTILTSLTTLFVAIVLYFFGGAGIHTFSFAMCCGVVVGTFCTMFIASFYLLLFAQMDAKNSMKNKKQLSTRKNA